VLLCGIPLLTGKAGLFDAAGWFFECTGQVFHELQKMF
jgi:hypothetical protein